MSTPRYFHKPQRNGVGRACGGHRTEPGAGACRGLLHSFSHHIKNHPPCPTASATSSASPRAAHAPLP